MRLVLACAATLCCFAANSLLARRALGGGLSGFASFTALRLLAGAAFLWLLTRGRRVSGAEAGWRSALGLFLYAAPFSWAYLRLSAGVGALLLFGTVQATMIGASIARGERPGARIWAGLAIALSGLAALTLPGAHAPPPAAALAMMGAGASWAWYSLRGKRVRDGIAATADAFIRSAPLAAVLWISALLVDPRAARLTAGGAALAVVSGAIASALGYSLWNFVLPKIRTTTAAILQLSVPAIAATGGIVLLGETASVRLIAGGATILGGIALAVLPRRHPRV